MLHRSCLRLICVEDNERNSLWWFSVYFLTPSSIDRKRRSNLPTIVSFLHAPLSITLTRLIFTILGSAIDSLDFQRTSRFIPCFGILFDTAFILRVNLETKML